MIDWFNCNTYIPPPPPPTQVGVTYFKEQQRYDEHNEKSVIHCFFVFLFFSLRKKINLTLYTTGERERGGYVSTLNSFSSH